LSRVITVSTASVVRDVVGGWRALHQTVALVPTMGNLHEGHLSLARLARNVADRVVMTIFVNPTQFGAGEDFTLYPRTLDEDLDRLERAAPVDVLFVPDEREIYPFGTEQAVRLVMPELSRDLCGASRPGHFDGVASVVCRLLNVVAPDVLVLGRKDYQQLILLERLVADLCLPVRIVSGRTLREPDGVAMSSRNRYLDAEQRRRAPTLRAALEHVRDRLHGSDVADHARLEQEAVDMLEHAGFEPDYVQIRRAVDLAKPGPGDAPNELIVVGAARLGRARLIDNTSD
jgi:pantoate--beta-alanine ligase